MQLAWMMPLKMIGKMAIKEIGEKTVDAAEEFDLEFELKLAGSSLDDLDKDERWEALENAGRNQNDFDF